ncbi:MAG: thiosulfate oxidation carrier complex protein SoxZ [Magnetococcales bacterium]|nr:thiosulfate oxidation carrier complex protein SoxZ [Magnetococcales bacterium]
MASSIGKAKIRVPKKVKIGDVIEVKALIRHPMETGLRKDKKTGQKVPAHFIDTVSATFNGETVLHSTWGAAISQDPMIGFHLKVDGSGPLVITWKDNKGGVYTSTSQVMAE